MHSWNSSETHWRKSSYSSGEGANGNCVEAAVTNHAVGVRDSKSSQEGTIPLTPTAWRDFLRHLPG